MILAEMTPSKRGRTMAGDKRQACTHLSMETRSKTKCLLFVVISRMDKDFKRREYRLINSNRVLVMYIVPDNIEWSIFEEAKDKVNRASSQQRLAAKQELLSKPPKHMKKYVAYFSKTSVNKQKNSFFATLNFRTCEK